MFHGEKSPNGYFKFPSDCIIACQVVLEPGNIVGVSTAIFIGGPGAVFWMWATAFLGASSAFIESTLGQIYKREEKGQYRGGPAFYIESGIKGKNGQNIWFNICCCNGCIRWFTSTGCTIQCNS
ncbi:Na+ alanine symporter [Staphylococcus gallinarum]|uniref:Na+ alanine symporter n=1 Tax=Staphylococcus gallinarum TaxID=1293 RepID=A0A380FEJ0_STAGA|nr:Na+ alanine symporter [Staphylococcus gallinarum]